MPEASEGVNDLKKILVKVAKEVLENTEDDVQEEDVKNAGDLIDDIEIQDDDDEDIFDAKDVMDAGEVIENAKMLYEDVPDASDAMNAGDVMDAGRGCQ